jgi:hypothetical protein
LAVIGAHTCCNEKVPHRLSIVVKKHSEIFPVVVPCHFKNDVFSILSYDLEKLLVEIVAPESFERILALVSTSTPSIDMVKQDVLPRLVIEVALNPVHLTLSVRPNLVRNLLSIEGKSVQTQQRKIFRNIYFVIPTLHESSLSLGSKGSIGRMVLEPEREHKLVELLLLLGEGSIVVVLAVIVAKSEENWYVREDTRH